jgi:hypothetical protein
LADRLMTHSQGQYRQQLCPSRPFVHGQYIDECPAGHSECGMPDGSILSRPPRSPLMSMLVTPDSSGNKLRRLNSPGRLQTTSRSEFPTKVEPELQTGPVLHQVLGGAPSYLII